MRQTFPSDRFSGACRQFVERNWWASNLTHGLQSPVMVITSGIPQIFFLMMWYGFDDTYTGKNASTYRWWYIIYLAYPGMYSDYHTHMSSERAIVGWTIKELYSLWLQGYNLNPWNHGIYQRVQWNRIYIVVLFQAYSPIDFTLS